MSLPQLTIYAPQSSPRLEYVADWLFCERLGFTYTLTSSAEEAATAAHCITYGFTYGAKNAIEMATAGLLWEININPHFINRRTWQGLHTLYFDEEADCDIPFDILSGIFYLLTRYEEYFKTEQDTHGRFPHTASILDFDDVLARPIVDEWIEYLRQLLEQRWNISIPKPAFAIEPTYDIDIAWAYKHKGAKRLLGAAFRDIASLKVGKLRERFSAQDPYDAFDWMEALHGQTGIQPQYFILAAEKATAFDKNISPHHPAMQALIKRIANNASIGLHPSYYSSEKPDLLTSEKALLESIISKPVHTSRQHYIRLRLPHTYRALITNGIRDDYSMGYPAITGFRAGTSHSFPWYDLENETTAPLHIHPFAFMDTTAHYYMQLSAEEAFQNLNSLKQILKPLGGRLTTIFHNFSLGTDKEWTGWCEAYKDFLQQ